MTTLPRLSIIIPVLNDSAPLRRLLTTLRAAHDALDASVEVIVVDGGSDDDSEQVARDLADQVLVSTPGRARQMNVGAGVAAGDTLWFLHTDATVSPELLRAVTSRNGGWGRCDVRLQPAGPLLTLVGIMMNLRSRLTGICTGDQGIFCACALFTRAGGFPDVPLMEDIALSARLRGMERPRCIGERIGVDSRRWRLHGTMRTILLMWGLRLRFFLGADPADLHRRYYRHSCRHPCRHPRFGARE